MVVVWRSSLLPFALLLLGVAGWCPEGCCEDTCDSCTVAKGLDNVGCVWCPHDGSCHNFGFPLEDKCTVPINTPGQCWGELCPLQIGGLLEGRPDAMIKWAETTLAAVDLPLREFPSYDALGMSGIYDLSTGKMLADAGEGTPVESPLRLGVAADWGSGTCESAAVASLIEAERPEYTLHLGDTYYAGTDRDCRTNFMGEAPNARQRGVRWPKGTLGTFSLNGNHEMISGGGGLIDTIFPYTGQHATHMVLQSDRWRIVGLDSAYNCYERHADGTRKLIKVEGGVGLLPETDAPQPDEVIRWLNETVRIGDPSDTRGIIFLSHHQPISDWEKKIYLGTANQLEKLLPSGRDVLWLFGHEHRFAIYDSVMLPQTSFRVFPRMIGHGGFADAMTDPGNTSALVLWDGRTYQEVGNDGLGTTKVGFNGHAMATFNGDEVAIEYFTVKCLQEDCQTGVSSTASTLLLREVFTVGSTGQLEMRTEHVSEELSRPNGASTPSPTEPPVASGKPTAMQTESPTARRQVTPSPTANSTRLHQQSRHTRPVELYIGAGALVCFASATGLAFFLARARRRSSARRRLLSGGQLDEQSAVTTSNPLSVPAP